MIRQMLERIAKRRLAADQTPATVLPSSMQAPDGAISSAGSQDPFSTIFPAPSRVSGARSGVSSGGVGNAWQMACETYTQQRSAGAQIPDQPALFADWSLAHLAVAQMFWGEHDQLHHGEVQIRSGDALLAVIQPAKRKVLIRPSAFQPQAPLALRQLPADQTLKYSAPASATQEQSISLYSLLWFYGQVYAEAPQLLPAEMGRHLIQLRRFPLVEPAALEMRHLALIHVFSGGALSFSQLQKLVLPEHLASLCPDLASLFFTGAIRLLDDQLLKPAA
jgi:hypothetical protein